MVGGNKMTYILKQTCSFFVAGLLKYAWSFVTTRHSRVNDLNRCYWCGTNIRWVCVIISMAYLQKFPKDFISRRGYDRWFWGISSSHLRYAGHSQFPLSKCLQILAKLYQLGQYVTKRCTETNGAFITSQKCFSSEPILS